MANILVTNTAPAYNRGSMGRMIGLLACLHENLPDAHVTIWHRFYKKENDLLSDQIAGIKSGVELKAHPWYSEYNNRPLTAFAAAARGGISVLGSLLNRGLRRLGLPLKTKYQPYDLIIDSNYVENDHSFSARIAVCLNLLNTLDGILSGKKVMICSATIPPFKSRFVKLLARTVLNRVTIITLRENISQDNLRAMGINKPPIIITGDLALMLLPASRAQLDILLAQENLPRPSGPIVGITPASEPGFAKNEDYAQLMAMISDYIVEELHASVLLVANTSYDAPMVTLIKQSVKHSEKVTAFPGFYTAQEVKGIIGMSSIFISPRFHALVAASSQGIPCVGIVTYNPTKFDGIIGRMMGLEDYLISVDSFDRDDMLNKIETKIKILWGNRETVSKALLQKAGTARANTLLNGELIKQLVSAEPDK